MLHLYECRHGVFRACVENSVAGIVDAVELRPQFEDGIRQCETLVLHTGYSRTIHASGHFVMASSAGRPPKTVGLPIDALPHTGSVGFHQSCGSQLLQKKGRDEHVDGVAQHIVELEVFFVGKARQRKGEVVPLVVIVEIDTDT